ncbi:conserved hypothetical protein [Perkinsus marinus ATCC 50983]|uniref:DNA mismatch repair proteins mutS family domain-containing protein n=1 Tax=Perkinsus marinus (strain ATCC 50983 / TXsc) TaxID=423536 RepID=C5K4G3_PERM5|nr:conserved hypothetical protein [Perkinsus marinus ATCC 50983]EER20656.1 conserved hypothetical protein [Perkinsus marinus ATCC 50983]|eukprot:XP_002788860.1 conserved hypothetical protein [Perkinsus marinus ATCC 50983]
MCEDLMPREEGKKTPHSRGAKSRSSLQAQVRAFLEAEGYGDIVAVQRKCFCEVSGREILEKARRVSHCIKIDPSSYHVSVASLGALVAYINGSTEYRLRMDSLMVTAMESQNVLSLDSHTIRALMLVVPYANYSPRSDSKGRSRETLLYVQQLFSCATSGGRRLLRQSLTQPLCDAGAIQERQGLVKILLQDEELFFGLTQQVLPSVTELEIAATRLATDPAKKTDEWSKAAIRNTIYIRQCMVLIGRMERLIEKASRKFESAMGSNTSESAVSEDDPEEPPELKALHQALGALHDGARERICKVVDTVVDAEAVKHLVEGDGSISSMKTRRVLASRGVFTATAQIAAVIHAGVDPVLDITRATWRERIREVDHIAKTYQEVISKNTVVTSGAVRLEFSEKKGYHLSFPRSAKEAVIAACRSLKFPKMDGQEGSSMMDAGGSDAGCKGQQDQVGTPKLITLGSAATRCSATSSLLTRVNTLLHEIEAALLFAPYNYKLSYESGRLQVITAPNGAGKSTYLTTLAVNIVLAQIGCLIPARRAEMQVIQMMFVRSGGIDDSEDRISLSTGQSSFSSEMTELSDVLENAGTSSSNALVLLDELGRGTSHDGGMPKLITDHAEDVLPLLVHRTNLGGSIRPLGSSPVFDINKATEIDITDPIQAKAVCDK